LLVSATLVAVTATICGPGSAGGAEYKPPLEIVPTAEFSDQVTAVFGVPVTVAVNCCVCLAERAAEPGETCTAMGTCSVTIDCAVSEGFDWLAAVTVTEKEEAMVLGAV
jgi:hypothetical protein